MGRCPTIGKGGESGGLGAPGRPGAALLGAILAAELLGLMLLKLPVVARFEGFAFADWGGNLTVQALLDRGMVPTVDFHYPYGLLPLAVGRAWFGLFGRTPAAYLAAIAACHLLTAAAIARFATARWVGWSGAAVAVVAAPILVPPTHANLGHAMETVLLAFALAEQARGRRASALSLATLAVLSKPSMAFPAGLAILVGIAAELRRSPGPIGSGVARLLGPAAAIGSLALLGLAAGFGPGAVLGTLLPAEAASLYDDAGYGFFTGSGRRFWLPTGAGLGHYLGTVRGFWIAGTLALWAGGLARLARLIAWRSEGDARAADESVVTCAALHAGFVTLFYASEFSWVYYGFVLLLGLVGMASRARGRAGLAVAAAVVLIGLLTLRTYPREILGHWREARRSPETLGLWTTPELAAEWAAALERTEGRRAALLSWSGAGEVLYPGRFGPPERLFLLPGMEGFAEVRRLADRVGSSWVVVRPIAASQGFLPFLDSCPALRDAMRGTEPALLGEAIEVFERRPGASPPREDVDDGP